MFNDISEFHKGSEHGIDQFVLNNRVIQCIGWIKMMGIKCAMPKLIIECNFPNLPLCQNASRTFTHRTLAHDWYFIDACDANRPF